MSPNRVFFTNCQIEAALKENFSYFDKIEMFYSDLDFKTTSD